MGRHKSVKNFALSLVTVFAAATAPSAVSDEHHQVNGLWQNEDIGTVDIQPCPNENDKFCGFLVDASPEAVQEFGLRVQNMGQTLVIRDLEPGRNENRLQNGRFENTNNRRAQRARLSISFNGENIMNVRASIGFLGENFAFKRIPDDRAPHRRQARPL